MSGSPKWKVYDAHGAYQAACKEGEAAACLVTLYGNGATIRNSHTLIVWREGSEEQSAAESYDHVAVTIINRSREAARKAYDKLHGEGSAAALMAIREMGRR